MFGRQTHNPGFTLETPYFPQAYGNYKQWENKPYGYKDAAENGEANNTMDIRRVDDQITMNSNPDDSKNIKDSNKEMFISNAAFETHVLYTGTRLGSGDTIKFYVESNKIFDDSKDVPRKVEIPQISDYLTKLARQSQQLSDYAERPTQLIQNLDKYNIAIENAKVYPKKHMKVYLGMGSGAQGSWIIGDNKNDVSYIFADSQGRLNPQFNMYVEKNGVKTHDFVFDYINITYNPFLLGAAQVGEGDAFVKPSGFLMLNSKFKVPGDTPKPEMTLNVDGVLKANGDLKQIIDFDETLNVEGKGIQLYIAKKGTPFGVADKCTLAWDTSSGVTERILKVTIPEHHLAEIEDPDDPPTKIKHLKTGDYKIKLTIPTSLGTAYTTVAYENLVNAKNKYPIYLKVIMDDPMFIGRPDLQTRVDIKYDITPYRMPGIN